MSEAVCANHPAPVVRKCQACLLRACCYCVAFVWDFRLLRCMECYRRTRGHLTLVSDPGVGPTMGSRS